MNYKHKPRIFSSGVDASQDFSRAARRVLFGKEDEIPGTGKSAAEQSRRHVRRKVTMNLDDDVLSHFKDLGEELGRPYQLLINDALREFIGGNRTERMALEVGKILLEESDFVDQVLRVIADKRCEEE